MFQAKCVLSGAQNVHEGPGLLLDLSCLFQSNVPTQVVLESLINFMKLLKGLVNLLCLALMWIGTVGFWNKVPNPIPSIKY